MIFNAEANAATQIACDIFINGGSFSAPSAALAAARAWPGAVIVLTEPTDWLGGQATAEGVAAIDNPWHDPGASLMRNHPTLYYPADYLDFLNRLKSPPVGAPGTGYAPNGTGWVSRDVFDPRTAAYVLDDMTSQITQIVSLKMTVTKNVQTSTVSDADGSGRIITGVTLVRRQAINGYIPFSNYLSDEMPDWYSMTDSANFSKEIIQIVPRDPAKGLVLVDASETGDLVVLSGATYTVGREASTEFVAEDGTPPVMNEHDSQACVFPFCMTGSATTGDENDVKADFPDFDSYYSTQLSSFFSLSSYTWNRVWTYRRLYCAGAISADSVYADDISMQNWYPGNDYPYGSILLDHADAAAQASDWCGGLDLTQVAQAEKHAVAFYFYMKSHRTSTWDTVLPRGSNPDNMMDTGKGLAKFPYIRGTRRIIGLDHFRLMSRYFVDTVNPENPPTSYRFFDSVGIGNYAVDIHPIKNSAGISPSLEKAAPFYIPYRALASANVRNLLVAGKLIATTYITNAAYRLHPVEWAAGSAAGTAAGLMSRDNLNNSAIMDPPHLQELRDTVSENSPIHWAAYDSSASTGQNGDLVVNDFMPVRAAVPFSMEIYHHRATRAVVEINGVAAGETTQKSNGRLIANNLMAPGGTVQITVICYDGEGNQLDILQRSLEVDDSVIYDDSDPEFNSSGSWTTASAQPDKYLTSYRYSFGSYPPSSAKWNFIVPAPGTYEVSIWYPESSNRATDSPFTVTHAEGNSTIIINQQLNGGRWVILGNFRFAGAPGEGVSLSNSVGDPAKLVVADAIRLRAVSAAKISNWNLY